MKKLAGHARELIEHSLKLLNDPVPDTFAGRKSHEPFPQEESRYGINDRKSDVSLAIADSRAYNEKCSPISGTRS
ncbi:hypothetical protein [Bradyrhizobium brasilense]|uniref:hypothetical protein n=1 Tax=Bradyrhizobium brasilense TaxID=1419277 RepID=UPI0011600931|nr:hypothetical protein [Bradyrhizobium brasilense]